MKNFIVFSIAVCCAGLGFSQGVKISPNPGAPHASAILEIQDSTKGFLWSRVTTVQRNAIANPAEGLTIYNMTTKCVETFFPGGWGTVACECTTPPVSPVIQGTLQACPGSSSVIFSVTPVPGAQSYTWSVDPQDQLVSGQGTNSISVNIGNGSGNRTLTVYASNSCGNSAPATYSVSVANPSAAYSFLPLQGSVGYPVTFTPNTPGLTYLWYFNSGNPATSTSASPSVTWSAAGTFQTALVITDNAGCSDSVSQTITIVNCPPGTQQFNFTNSIVNWQVPNCVTQITIEAWGAQGGNTGGLGAYMKGDFTVTPGQTLQILVGEMGEFFDGSTYDGGGGGGGTFVASNNNPLIVAGGGGGKTTYGSYTFMDAVVTTNGQSTLNNGGGTGGNGGGNGISNGPASGGGGFFGNGTNGDSSTGGKSFVNGGAGGGWSGNTEGGFGGGGGGHQTNYHRSGGGGGYSGGQGGTWDGQQSGGGGGSYNGGSNQTNTGANNSGNGKVIISW